MHFFKYMLTLVLLLPAVMSYAMEHRPPPATPSTTSVTTSESENPFQSIIITKSKDPYQGNGVLILASNSKHPKLGGAGFFVNGKNEIDLDNIQATPKNQYIGSRVLCTMLDFFPQTKEVYLGSYGLAKVFYIKLDFTQTPGPDSSGSRGSDYFFWYSDAWNKHRKKFRFTRLNENQIQVDLIPKNNPCASPTPMFGMKHQSHQISFRPTVSMYTTSPNLPSLLMYTSTPNNPFDSITITQ